MKTSKSKLTDAVDSFYWHVSYVTGGTREESLRQAPHAIKSLEAKAALVATLASTAGKIALADSHLMERAANIPARLQSYRERYLGATPAPEPIPTNIIPFPVKHPTAAKLFAGSISEQI